MTPTPWNKLATIAAAGIGTIALSVALVGCGSSTDTDEATDATETSVAEEASAEETTSAAETPAAGAHQTISDYIKANNIQETILKRGDPGPAIDLPVPEGWQATDELPQAPYGAIVFQSSAVPDNPPRILALLSKLTGDVDPAQILALAPGELQNIPGYDGPTEGQSDSLGGYDAVQLGGNYDANGKKAMIAQKTVVIPGEGALFVLQLNAYSDESEADILANATSVVDEQTTITP